MGEMFNEREAKRKDWLVMEKGEKMKAITSTEYDGLYYLPR